MTQRRMEWCSLPEIKSLEGGEGRTEPRELNVLPQTCWTYMIFLPNKGQWTWDWLDHWVITGTHKPLHCKGVSPCEHQVVCRWFLCTDVDFWTLELPGAETGPYTQRTSRDLRKRQTLQMSRWQVISRELTYEAYLCASRWVVPTPACQSLQVDIEYLTAFSHVQMISTKHSSL